MSDGIANFNNMKKEVWKPIVGYESFYEISNLGRVKTFHKRKGIGFILKPTKNVKGHGKVYLCGNTNKFCIVSRLVAQHFIPNPNNLPCACHKKEDLDENGLLYNGEDNLFWGSYKDNMQDMIRKGRNNYNFVYNNPKSGLGKFGKLNPNSKKVNQYTLSGEFIKIWDSIADAERELKIGSSHISKCCKGKYNQSGGFKWKYIN